ncbi:hypothetical protein ACHWQZ_G016428 [Mnemiopsis leidyi]
MPILALLLVLSSAIQTARSIQNEKAWEAIRYGYVVDKNSPNFLSRGDVIFDVPEQSISDIIAISARPTMNRKMVYSDSTQTASTKVEASLSLKGSYGAFSGAASMAVSSSSDSSVKTVRLDCYIKAIQYEVSAIGSLRTTPQNHLTENFKTSVNTLSPEQLEEMIGVFYARSLDLGGEVRKSYTMQATKEDNESSVSAEVSAAYLGNSFTAKVGVSTRTTNEKAQMNEDWSAKGGDATVWLQADPSEQDTSVQAKWAKTINDDNLFPFNFEMKPMWELVKAVNQKKGEEFEKYLLDKWSRQSSEFSPTRFLSTSEWTKHTTSNMRGYAIQRLCPEGQRVTKVTWFEQNGYGLVDLQIDCGGQQLRFTNNNNGGPNGAKTCRGGFSAIQGREQNGYGIINARMWCRGDSHYSDSNRNYRGYFKDTLDCAGKVLTGLEVREQGGYGIINFKAFCTSLADNWEPQKEWSSLSNTNMRGGELSNICPTGKRITKLTWYEQNGYGLVDVKMECGDYSHRFTANNNGFPNSGKSCSDGFSVVQGREQHGYGIINIRMKCRGDSNFTDSNVFPRNRLSNYNGAGKWKSRVK